MFAAVARRLSFTAAARELHLTQPGVSLHLRELEDDCGLRLFDRVGRRLALTEAGAELQRCVGAIEQQLRDTRERLDSLRGLHTGLLQVGAVGTAKYVAPALLAAIQRRHPGVTIRFGLGNREEMVRPLGANETDMILMGRPPVELDTEAAPFARHPMAIIAASTPPLAGRRRIGLERLAEEDFLLREPASGTRAAMERLFAERGVAIRASVEVSSNETIKQAVMAGMGISFISAPTIGLELEAGKLVVLRVAGLPVVRDWYVIHLRGKRLSPMAAAFRRFPLEEGAPVIETATGGRAG